MRLTRRKKTDPQSKPFSPLGLLAVFMVTLLWFFVCSDGTHHGVAQAASAAAQESGAHTDPVIPLLTGISVILLAAKVAGDLMVRFKQPAVLGELLIGVVLGNLVLFGFSGLEFLRLGDLPGDSPNLVAVSLDMLARIGVILLLFEVGLESNVREMIKVGWSSLLVAIFGVVAPIGLGWATGRWLLPDESWHVHLFLGATLCATSVGITARVLKDLGKSHTDVAKIVLGAAVIDDILGLVVLAVVQAIIVNGSASLAEVMWLSAKAFGFLFIALAVGDWISPRLFRLAAVLRVHGMLMVTGLVICFGLAWSASLFGLAPIVGAFAAGLILDEKHYAALHSKDERSMEDWILPVTTLFVPIFFVMMGFQVDLPSFRDPEILLLAAGLIVAAVLGKQSCALGVLDPRIDRLSVGISMIPRGEVGLIFAAIGRGLTVDGQPVISPGIYSAVIVMVMLTTLATPPLLTWSLRRRDTRQLRIAEHSRE
ncbi:MAG: cation:proton antiporter [Pirellulales bacterium]